MNKYVEKTDSLKEEILKKVGELCQHTASAGYNVENKKFEVIIKRKLKKHGETYEGALSVERSVV